jgi:isoquinoline 1-oxidoreductase
LVTAFSGKVDVGQDNTTAFRLLVAEELRVTLSSVHMVMGDTDYCPFDWGTFGSRSMPDAGEALRRAAAGARQLLLGLAARRFDVPVSALAAAGGTVEAGTAGSVGYGALVEGLQIVEVLGSEPALTPPSEWQIAGRAGQASPRRDAVAGTRTFGSDLVRPGMLYGAVLRPPGPEAQLRRLDTTVAEHLPGVMVVRQDQFAGVVAADLASARGGAAALEAEWDPIPPGPADLPSHLRSHPVSGEGWQGAFEQGGEGFEEALASSAITVSATYASAYLAHTPLETRVAIAEWQGDDLTVWVGTQLPFGVRTQLAQTFGIGEESVRVIVPPTGSAFGGKHRGDVAVEAARLAQAAGRPVKVHWTRQEEMIWGYLRPMALIDVRAGLGADGSISAWELVNINAGSAGISFPYRTGSLHLAYQPAASPLSRGSYRALAATANQFARESHIDDLARRADTDPVEFRLRHLDDERLAAALVAATERFGWTAGAGRERPDVAGADSGRRGQGVAVGREKDGRVATCAEVVVDGERRLRLTRLVTAYECGAIVNPDVVANQVEGAVCMALGGALFEGITLDHGKISNASLAAYRVPRFGDIPQLEVVLLDRPDLPSAGAGEAPLVAVAPAIANAIVSACGVRNRSLPLAPLDRLPD